MKYILNMEQMRNIDETTINEIGISADVLMERAALEVVKVVKKKYNKCKVICVCGLGNNGADCIAVARILGEHGYTADIMLINNNINNPAGSKEFNKQLNIARNIGINIVNNASFNEYNLIIDGIFGIGISRDITGEYQRVIEEINSSKAEVVSVDIPSGVNASNGHILNVAVKATYTVTFGYNKLGLVLFPGADYVGELIVSNIGFPNLAASKISDKAFIYTHKDIKDIPKRKKNSNKGNYGKVLIIAGSKTMGGAACLSAASAYRSGGGVVKVYTHNNNAEALLKWVPEAIVSTYTDNEMKESIIDELRKSMQWASHIILGPGISKDEKAHIITEYVIQNTTVPTIVDADALSILKELKLKNKSCAQLILTPHIGEMARLTQKSISDIKLSIVDTAKEYARENNVICVLKDSRTIVADSKGKVYINTSGNSGMATGGSGDVLTGVLAGIIANYTNSLKSIYEAVCMGVYVHGLAGGMAAKNIGEYGMKAMDIVDSISKVIKNEN